MKNNFEVCFIGPFYTGFFVPTATLINQGYKSIQTRILKKIQDKGNADWFVEGKESNKGDLIWDIEYKSVHGGTTKVPSSFLGRKLVFNDVIVEFKGIPIKFTHGVLFFHDYGVGTFRVNVSIQVGDADLPANDLRELVEQFSPKIGDQVNNMIKTSTEVLKKNLINSAIPIEKYEEESKKLKEKGLQNIIFDSCLWYHRVFFFEIDSEGPLTEKDFDEYRDLLYSSQIQGPKNCSLHDDAQVYPSFGFSLFLHKKGQRPADILLNRILELSEYFYAATGLLDSIIFSEMNEFSRFTDKTHKIKEVKAEVESLKDLNEKLELFLLLIKDSVVNFTPNSLIMFRNLDTEWNYTPILDNLQEKNELLNQKVNDLLKELEQNKSAKLNKLVKVFTVFAIIGPILEFYNILRDMDILP